MAVTNSLATAYSNQKKLVALSTGRKVMVYAETTANGKFRWSDDGAAWTDYSADIAGFINGSIAAYVDAGGTERLVAFYVKNTNASFCRVGTFNAGRTTLTWGVEISVDGGTVYAKVTDVVAYTEGAGGVAHLVTGTADGYVRYSPLTIDSGGTGTLGSNTDIKNLGVSFQPYPSVDYDPTTKRLFLAWSAETTGAGKGIRFRTASYSGGVWTWATEVEVYTSAFVNDATQSVKVHWDSLGSRAVIVASLSSPYDVLIWDSTTFTSFTNRLTSNIGTIMYSMGSAIDQGTGDVYILGSKHSGTNYQDIAYYKVTRSGATLSIGTRVIADAFLGTAANPPYANATYSNGRIEWVYTHGNNSPYAVKYDYIDVNAAPTVTLVTPANNFSVNLNTTAQNFAWTVTDSEGDTQAKYVFRRRKPEHSTYEYWDGVSAWTSTLTEVVSTTNNVSITAGTWAGSQSWLWSVGVRDTSAASPIGYSSERTITNSAFTPTVNTYVGSFTKQAATGNQDITITPDLTAAPAGSWAIVFWKTGSELASGTWDDVIRAGIGFAANGGGTVSQYAMSAASQDAVATSDTGRRLAAKAVTIGSVDGSSVLAEAEMGAIPFPSATTMRLNWTTNWPGTDIVNYMIITGLTGAKALVWTMPTTAIAKSVTGVGFKPDLVLTMTSQATTGGVMGSGTYSMLSLGAMNKHGQQWANAVVSNDGFSPTQSARYQQTDACTVGTYTDASSEYVYWQGHYQSMDSDGFSINFSTVVTTATTMISLCLSGVSSKLGAFTRVGGTANTVDRVGFQPKGLLFSSKTTAASSGPEAQAVWNMGAFDGTNRRSAALADTDAAATTDANSIWSSTYDIYLGDTGSVDRGLGTTTITSTGFTTSWVNGTGLHNTEILYLALGDPATNTAPATVGTSTNSVATAYSNQKKLVRLSTGRMVSAYGDTTTNAKFKWSDDGQTWTDYAADIAGWSNGSISTFRDGSGQESIVVAWKQSGTGGGRTDGYLYTVAGTFNIARTTITWGTVINFDTDTNLNYPDITTAPHGNGGIAHLAVSAAAATPIGHAGWLYYSVVGNVMTLVQGRVTLGANGSVNVHTWPSICIDPVTKRVHIAWSKGQVGAGHGIRYATIPYTTGNSWAYASGTDVEVDNTRYTGDKDRWVVCRWDATNSTIVLGAFLDGTTRDLVSYESTNFTSFTTRVLVTNPVNANGLFSGGMGIDIGTGDRYFFGSPFIGGSYADIWYYKWVKATTTLGPKVVADAFVAASSGGSGSNAPYANINYNSSANRIEWVYAQGNNSPYSVKYDYIATGAPVVTLTAPENGARVDLNTNSQNFAWSISDAEGNAQTHYIFRRRRDGHTSYEYWNAAGSAWTATLTENASATMNVTIGAGKWTAGKNYSWSVGVKDSTGAIGYSDERLITNSAATVQVHVGSFTSSAATGNQDITIPVDLTAAEAGTWAVMFWTTYSRNASGVWDGLPVASVGFAANGGGSISQYAVGVAGTDGAATSDNHRRVATACITIPHPNSGSPDQASFVAFQTATTMRINWTDRNYSGSNKINYMIIAGLAGSKVVNWMTDSAAGLKYVTGAGFSPDLVFQATAVTNPPPTSAANVNFAFGIMNKHGQQWANAFASVDNDGGGTDTRTRRWQNTDASLAMLDTDGALYSQIHFNSLQASDGFVIYQSDAVGSVINRSVISLCIKGVSSKVGSFTLPGSTGNQPVQYASNAAAGLTVRGALFTNIQSSPAGAPTTHALWSLGATDTSNNRASGVADKDSVATTVGKSIWHDDASLITVANDSSETSKATWVSSTSTSFTLNYTSSLSGTESLYLLLGDAENSTLPATIGTSTASTATAYSNQKKLVRLSTGRMVAVYGDTGSNAKFKYSDDGITWVDMQSDIAGWANGSLFVTADDRIFVAWKQTGTGGGRVDLSCYTMVGTLNSAKTGISWSAASSNGIGDSRHNYPDLVACNEGSGYKVWVGVSFNRVSPSVLQNSFAYRFGVDSNGAFTGGGNYELFNEIIADNAVAVSQFISMDINPVTKDIYVAGSSGSSGAGKGIRYKKATYSAGSWTWGAEREIDSNRYIDSATNQRWIKCVYDGTAVVIAGSLLGSSKTDVIIYERDAADTTTTPRFLFDNNAGVTWYAEYGSFAVDALRNVYITACDRSGNQLYWKWIRNTATLDPRVVTDSLAATGVSHTSALYANDRVHYVYTVGNNSPYAVKYDYISATDEEPDNILLKWGIIPI